MRYQTLKILTLVGALQLAVSCKKDTPENNSVHLEESVIIPEESTSEIVQINHPTLTSWTNYYQNKVQADFSLDNFQRLESQKLTLIEGSITPNYASDFNSQYEPFLIYNADKTKYLDIDSYKWDQDADQQVAYNVDQEIALVDVTKKTVTRLAFRGSSEWVEDAFWLNDNQLILLENSEEKQPMITQIDLINNTITFYLYKNQLEKDSGYYTDRIQKLLP